MLDIVVAYANTKGSVEKTTFGQLLQKKKYTVLYFYPKDNTPGCTIEAKEFSELLKAFDKADTQIIGVSKDSGKSHCRFQEEHELTIGLISDKDKILQGIFKAEGPKKFMGKEYIGTLRNTYFLDNKGTILYKWENVTPL